MNIWNETIWKEINDEVRKVAGTVRVAQKVFPTVILDNPSNIPDDSFNRNNFTIAEGLTKPLVEISEDFRLTPNQVVYEGSLHTGLKLAKLRAADLARIEDLILFQGTAARIAGVNVSNVTAQSVGTGLLGLATNNPLIPPITVPRFGPAPPGVIWGTNTLNAVVLGISLLNGQSQPGPFALILDYRIIADAYSVLGPNLTTTADLITPLVTGGLFGTAALGPFTGLLVSLGGEPTTLYVGVDATAAVTFKDQADNYSFRVFERVQFDARDPRAFVRLNFEQPEPVVLSVIPTAGPAGTRIEIRGFAFTDVSSVDFGGTPVNPPYVYADDASIRFVSPAHAAGKIDIRVTTPAGTSPINGADKFTCQ
jgi:uncharacterized linocin/CFP29 family protein